MRTFALLLPWLAGQSLAGTDAATMIPVEQRSGRLYVAASALARGQQIAIKELPGQKAVAACYRERCALVDDVLRGEDELLLPVQALAERLGATARFGPERNRVAFEFTSAPAAQTVALPRVGQLAPNFRVPTLDGRAVSLADFRGKRVLINSWASW